MTQSYFTAPYEPSPGEVGLICDRTASSQHNSIHLNQCDKAMPMCLNWWCLPCGKGTTQYHNMNGKVLGSGVYGLAGRTASTSRALHYCSLTAN